MDSEAMVLWDDVIVLLKEKSIAPSYIAMLESCVPESLEPGVITVSTKMGFVKHYIEKFKRSVEDCLEEAAFQPMKCHVLLERKVYEPAIDTHSDLTRVEVVDWQKRTASPIRDLFPREV